MPRNVRNWWLELQVDGSKSRVETGPRAADGGFTLRIRQRDHGDIITAVDISGRVLTDGRLVLTATANDPSQDANTITVETRR